MTTTDVAAEIRELRVRLAAVAERLPSLASDQALEAAVALRDALATCTAAEQVALVQVHDAFPPDPPHLKLSTEERASEVAAEIGMAYGCSWWSARNRLGRAHDYQALPALLAAMLAGQVDTAKAWTLLDRTRHLSDADAAEVTDRLLARHAATDGGLTGPAWSRLLGRIVLAVDPTSGEARAGQSRRDRAAWHKALDEATGSIGLTGPLHLTAQAWAEIDAAARSAQAADRTTGGTDGRSLDQWRFDIARERLQHGLAAGDQAPDPASDRNGTPTGPAGGDQPAPADRDDAEPASDTAPAGPTRAGQAAEDAGQAAGAAGPGTRGGDVVTHGGRTCPVLNITVPLSTLLGVDDAPGEIAGIGAIPASVARDLAQTAAVWRRLLTDPVDGHLVVQDVKTYRPTAAQRRFVLARHGWASAARASTTRTGLQVDHADPYAAGGPTSALNLPPLDEQTHHRKTDRRWQHTYDGKTGRLTQTTRLGRTYPTTPLPPVGPTGTRAAPPPHTWWPPAAGPDMPDMPAEPAEPPPDPDDIDIGPLTADDHAFLTTWHTAQHHAAADVRAS